MPFILPTPRLSGFAAAAIAAACALSAMQPAAAQTAPAAAPAAAAPAAAPATPASWFDTLKFSAQVDAGVVINPYSPGDGLNFGQSFTDRSNSVLLNQLLLTATRPLDSKATGYDFGFKLQGMYGTDARYTHYLGIWDYVTNQRTQVDLVEANVQIHTPWLTDGGIDFKLGLFATPIGYETIDPSTNPFYTHSYIFNYALPFKQSGGYAVVHLTPNIDIYGGADSGVNTTFGANGDNNTAAAGMAGFGLTLLDGNLTVLGLTHFGPETPARAFPNADCCYRYENDVVVTYKATPSLTFVTEAAWIHDDYFKADGYGAAQYVSYAYNEQITLNARAEVFRDQNGFFVAAFPNSLGPVNALGGFPATVIGGGQTTYGALTLGFTYKPTVPAPISNLAIRPELRWDTALNGTNPFNSNLSGTKSTNNSVLISADVILSF
ncbi:MAG: porin [Proteobacteria bacterium]|nr:porin [Pseudomonadota bacterium]